MFKYLLLCFALNFVSTNVAKAGDEAKTVEVFFNLLSEEKYKEASELTKPELKAFLAEDKIKEFWSSIKSRFGKVEKFETPIPQKSTKDQVFLVTLRFKEDSLNARIMIDSNSKVSGLLFVPFAKNYDFEPPSYSEPSKFKEEDVKFGLEDWKLPGTLSIPIGKEKSPAIVLVHGSGPNDRDETIGGFKVFRDLAFGFASKGVAVLRYEKRTKQHAQKFMRNSQGLTIREESIEDAIEAVKFLKNREDIDSEKIYILGHSLGGYVLPRIYSEYNDFAGMIIMNGNARQLQELIPYQFEYIMSVDGVLDDFEKEQIRKAQEQVDFLNQRKISPDTPQDSLLLGLPAAYWLDLLDYYPTESVKKVEIPILVLQGGKDYQVTKIDFDLWREALKGKRNASFKYFDNLNHLMVFTEGKSKPADYEKSGNVEKEVIDAVFEWINTKSKK